MNILDFFDNGELPARNSTKNIRVMCIKMTSLVVGVSGALLIKTCPFPSSKKNAGKKHLTLAAKELLDQ